MIKLMKANEVHQGDEIKHEGERYEVTEVRISSGWVEIALFNLDTEEQSTIKIREIELVGVILDDVEESLERYGHL